MTKRNKEICCCCVCFVCMLGIPHCLQAKRKRLGGRKRLNTQAQMGQGPGIESKQWSRRPTGKGSPGRGGQTQPPQKWEETKGR